MLHSVMSIDVSNVVNDDTVEVLAAKTFQVSKIGLIDGLCTKRLHGRRWRRSDLEEA